MVKLAQLVRASDCGSEGRGFKSHISPKAGNSCFFIYEQNYSHRWKNN